MPTNVVVITLATLVLSVNAQYMREAMTGACAMARSFTSNVNNIKEFVQYFDESMSVATIHYMANPAPDSLLELKSISRSLGDLVNNPTSPKAWQQIQRSLQSVVGKQVLAYSVLGISVVYLVDTICWRNEIEALLQDTAHREFRERLERIQQHWDREKVLITEFKRRIGEGNFEFKPSDALLLGKIEALMNKARALLYEIRKEIPRVKSKYAASSTYALASLGVGSGVGAVGWAIFGGSLPVIGGVIAAAVGAIYNVGNIGDENRYIRDLERMERDVTRLYEDIQSDHDELKSVMEVMKKWTYDVKKLHKEVEQFQNDLKAFQSDVSQFHKEVREFRAEVQQFWSHVRLGILITFLLICLKYAYKPAVDMGQRLLMLIYVYVQGYHGSYAHSIL
ncbi:uncharacterized protein LOC102802174 [Saccoglossus kowalevskii]|uniref:Uncharacterized protein LOC102802174 n=1 Tax=Saccoglossus kowalevskii TaxID=10224 RepID=A0ABM0MVT7_SACKO|nr:PREDICTED: uncharacterized protein LOC102802174 [Saccoglossus kowalevskii]